MFLTNRQLSIYLASQICWVPKSPKCLRHSHWPPIFSPSTDARSTPATETDCLFRFTFSKKGSSILQKGHPSMFTQKLLTCAARSFASETGLPRLRLRGLPFHATSRDIRGFFQGFRLASPAVELLRNGRRPTGQAFAYFEDVVEAMKAKDGFTDSNSTEWSFFGWKMTFFGESCFLFWGHNIRLI